MSVKADNPIIMGLSNFRKLCTFTKKNNMKKILYKIRQYLELGGIDSHIKELRARVDSFNGLTNDVYILEQAIEKLDNRVLKHSVKRNLLDHLQYLTQKDAVDNAW